MLDTLRVGLQDYEIARESQLVVQPSPVVWGSGKQTAQYWLGVDAEGRMIEGAKAYYNDPLFQVSLGHLWGEGEVVQRVGCVVQLSIPKYFWGGINYYPVNREETGEVFRDLEMRLRDVGIRTDIQRGRIIRLDMFRNVETEEPVSSYWPVLELLEAKRTQKRDYGTTLLWWNGEQEVCCYNKREELQRQKVDISGFPETLRVEYRLKSSRKVRNTLGIETVRNLQEEYGVVPEGFRKVMRENLFRYHPPEVEILCEDQLERELCVFRERYGRNWLDWYLKAIGVYHLAQRVNLGTFGQVVERISGGDRKKVWRVIKKLEQAQVDFAMTQEEPVSQKTLVTLYEELREKVLLVA